MVQYPKILLEFHTQLQKKCSLVLNGTNVFSVDLKVEHKGDVANSVSVNGGLQSGLVLGLRLWGPSSALFLMEASDNKEERDSKAIARETRHQFTRDAWK